MSAASTRQPTYMPSVPRRWTLPATSEGVPGARHRVMAALTEVLDRTHDGELADDLSLVVSELVTNAVRHGSRPGADHLVEVTLWRADGYLWLAVSDAGEGELPVRAAPPAFDACHGRGLLLVDAIADVRVVLPRPGVGKSVVAGLRLPIDLSG